MDISNDESSHAAIHRQMAKDLNLDISPSLNRLRRDTVDWMLGDLKAAGKYGRKGFWEDSSDSLFERGVAPGLTQTAIRSALVLSAFWMFLSFLVALNQTGDPKYVAHLQTLKEGVLAISVLIGSLVLLGLIIQLFWNWVIALLFGLNAATFLTCLGIALFLSATISFLSQLRRLTK